jgi:hypothetical protein
MIKLWFGIVGKTFTKEVVVLLILADQGLGVLAIILEQLPKETIIPVIVECTLSWQRQTINVIVN